MFNRGSRWSWLTALALCNLVVWVAIAGVVGLLVGDGVDLGVETLIREGQATAVAAWKEVSEQKPAPAVQPTALPPTAVRLASAGEKTDREPAPPRSSPTSAVRWSRPAAAASTPTDPPTPATALSPVPGKAVRRPTHTSAPTSPPATPVAPPQTPTAVPSPTPITRPLLLADPQISSLTTLDAEMARSAPGRAVQIRYQEAALNQEIAMLWQNNPDLPFRNVQVDLKRDTVVLSGKVTVLGFQVDATVTGNVTVEDCLPLFEIQSISVAGIMTPRFVRDEIEKMVLDAMTWYPADYPLCLEQIVLEETRATVYGHHR
jgi:hypothetical protein